MEEPVLNINVDELTDYAVERLRREGTARPKEDEPCRQSGSSQLLQ